MRLAAVLSLMLAGYAWAGDSTKQPELIVKPETFTTLVNPQCSHCRDEAKRRADELRPDDRVLCWFRGYSDGGAIPYRFFLNPYRVISDSYGVFVYDADAGYARGFAPSYNFRFHGWRNGVMVMKHKDGTLYSCLTGLAFDGPKKGTRLQPIPTLVSDWGYWLEHYPQAVAYHMFDKYKPHELTSAGSAESRKSRGPADARLPAETQVLGVWTGKTAKAYPLESMKKVGLIEDNIDGRPCVILSLGATQTASAFLSIASAPRKYAGPMPNEDGEPPPDRAPRTPNVAATLILDEKEPAAPFVDKQTSSRWDIAGRCVSGTRKGWTLQWLDSTQVKWLAWAAEYPGTQIYGK